MAPFFNRTITCTVPQKHSAGSPVKSPSAYSPLRIGSGGGRGGGGGSGGGGRVPLRSARLGEKGDVASPVAGPESTGAGAGGALGSLCSAASLVFSAERGGAAGIGGAEAIGGPGATTGRGLTRWRILTIRRSGTEAGCQT